MVIPIDAVQYGAGFDERGRWHEARTGLLAAERQDDDPMNPARGIIWGLLLSGILWLGLIGAARAIIGFFAGF